MPEDQQPASRHPEAGPGGAGETRREVVWIRLLGGFSARVGGREVGRGHGGSAIVGGDFARAQGLYEESLETSRAAGDGVGVPLALWLGAFAALGCGDHAGVKGLCARGLEVARRVGYGHAVALLVHVLAASAGARGGALRSARLWGAAEALLDAAGYGLGPAELHHYAPYTATARAALGDDEAWEESLAEGRAMKPGVVEYAFAAAGTASVEAGDGPPRPASIMRRGEEIAALVARGLTNRQIPSELSISRRTAGNRVASVLKKLNLRSCAEADARLRDLALQGGSS